MINVEIGRNESGQRLDRFLKKYLVSAPLSKIYKIIRKDVKVNGKRVSGETFLEEGDKLALYITDQQYEEFTSKASHPKVKRQFQVVYEDDNLLVVDKPVGLLTHGDGKEKKNHLANQVISYLIEKGDYNPRLERTFVPAPSNRLDRNTAGLVIFGKNAEALRLLNQGVKDKEKIKKFYLTIAEGKLEESLGLSDFIVKDEVKNKVTITSDRFKNTKNIETRVKPIKNNGKYTLCQVELLTGRSHQIRVHMASVGHPLMGDVKYGGRKAYGLDISTQFLYAYKLEFNHLGGILENLDGLIIETKLKGKFKEIKEEVFGENEQRRN